MTQYLLSLEGKVKKETGNTELSAIIARLREKEALILSIAAQSDQRSLLLQKCEEAVSKCQKLLGLSQLLSPELQGRELDSDDEKGGDSSDEDNNSSASGFTRVTSDLTTLTGSSSTASLASEPSTPVSSDVPPLVRKSTATSKSMSKLTTTKEEQDEGEGGAGSGDEGEEETTRRPKLDKWGMVMSEVREEGGKRRSLSKKEKRKAEQKRKGKEL